MSIDITILNHHVKFVKNKIKQKTVLLNTLENEVKNPNVPEDRVRLYLETIDSMNRKIKTLNREVEILNRKISQIIVDSI